MSTDVISVRIRRDLKEAIRKYGINVKKVIERALEEEVRRVRRMKFKELVEEALDSIDLTIEDWIRSVEEDRSR